MSRGQVFEEKRKYVESLNDTLKVVEDFDYIKYGRSCITEQEYIKIADKLGSCAYLDVTAMSNECILKEVAVMLLGKVPKSYISSIELKREIVPLFR